jgi:hypothetical protein
MSHMGYILQAEFCDWRLIFTSLEQCSILNYRDTVNNILVSPCVHKHYFIITLKPVKMGSLHNIVICLQYKFLNRNLLSFLKYGRHFSSENCCTRKKMEAVKFVTFQRELKIQGYRRFTSISNLTSVNASFSKMKYTSFITSTEFSVSIKHQI